MIVVRNERFAADLGLHDGVSTLAELRESYLRNRVLICYQTGVIIPPDILATVRAAYNFHAGPPECPGRDPHHWAVYRGMTTFGVTCHEMTAKVDDGPILFVRRFPIIGLDWWQVRDLAAKHLVWLYWYALPYLQDGTARPTGDRWGPIKTARRDMLDLCRLTSDLEPAEVARRRRAFDGDGRVNAGYPVA